MFTGLIAAQARLLYIKRGASWCRLALELASTNAPLLSDVSIGDSIAVQGVCLTVVQIDLGAQRLGFDLMPETLEVTSLGSLTQGESLNIEKALRLGDYLGGHLVSGDVDGQAKVFETQVRGNAFIVRLRPLELRLLECMVLRGRVAIDGASLTLMEVSDSHFAVSLIPHTQLHIGLGQARPGQICNIETDLLARHLIKAKSYA